MSRTKSKNHSVLPLAFLLLPLFLSFFTLALYSAEKQFSGEVVRVADGDTIAVMHLGHAEKIRLQGIDCPETGQPFGSKAKLFTSSQCFAKQVIVQVITTDKYRRTVGVVILPDGKNLNHEIVKAGFAWWYKQYAPKDEILRQLEQGAKNNKVGLWVDKNPIPPWDFRRNPNPRSTIATEIKEPSKEHQIIPSDSQAETVCITKTGTKYHIHDCTYAKNHSMSISLTEAKKRYKPCSVCKPPQQWTNKERIHL